jgi:hypothetical protein
MRDAIAQLIAKIEPCEQRVPMLELCPVGRLALPMAGQHLYEDGAPVHGFVANVLLQVKETGPKSKGQTGHDVIR